MSNGGYIYVLINASVDGLTRVGKTAGDPKVQAQELSAATDLPTPFIVAFDAWFDDAGEAERQICDALDRQGYRVANNRGFFSAPLNEVVKIVLEAGGQLESSSPTEGGVIDDPAKRSSEELRNSLSVQTSEPWEDVFEQAEAYRYGLGDTLQDDVEAMKLFKEAARLGSAKAYREIGDMYQYGKGVRENDSSALEYYKQGATTGDIGCYAEMSGMFMRSGHFENAQKCWRKFAAGDHSPLENWEIGSYGYWYFYGVRCNNLPLESLDTLRGMRELIMEAAEKYIAQYTKERKLDLLSRHEVTLQQIRITLFEDAERTGEQ